MNSSKLLRTQPTFSTRHPYTYNILSYSQTSQISSQAPRIHSIPPLLTRPSTVFLTWLISISPYLCSTRTCIAPPAKKLSGIVKVSKNLVRAAERRSETLRIREVFCNVSVIGCFDFIRASSVRKRVER